METHETHIPNSTAEVKPEQEKFDMMDGDKELNHTPTDETPSKGESDVEGESADADVQRNRFALYFGRYRWVVTYALIVLVMTGWWIVGLVLHRKDLGWLIPFLVWAAVVFRIITLYVSTKYITKPIGFLWINLVNKPVQKIPQKFRLPLGAAGTIAVILIGTYATPETADNTRVNRTVSLSGLIIFHVLLYATSRNKKIINWQAVIVGTLLQFLLALFVLRTKAGYDIFNFISYLARSLLGFADQGTEFLTSPTVFTSGYFIISVIPPIIFFISFIQLLYYWGWLQWGIKKLATVFYYSMGVSGAEAVVAAASPFVGQGESAMLIKPFIAHLTEAELHQIMTSGFATIAGSVLAAYISLGISAVSLVSSCVMSIPSSLSISKLRYPETEESLTAGKITVPEDTDEKPANSLHAFANGSWLGIKIGGMIIAVLLCIVALLGLCNGILGWWGRYLNIPALSIQFILGYLFWPIAFFLGVERKNGDVLKVAQLIGTKIVANEFVAFVALTSDPTYATLSSRSRLIATYALCGFGNIGSIGIQIGVLSQLAPGQSGRIAKVALSALFSGVISTLTSASIAGMLITDQAKYTQVA